jgi:hypothetical protein
MPNDSRIEVEYDEATLSYFVIWRPVIIGSGATRNEALEDLSKAAHFCIDTFVGLELKDAPG